MAIPQLQTALVQSPKSSLPSDTIQLIISHSVPVPDLPSAHHVLVRVLAVALNPTDHKMVMHFPNPGSMVGCDFCGVVQKGTGSDVTGVTCTAGTRVCGAIFPYAPTDDLKSGAFAEWAVADVRLLVRVPDHWDDFQAAALGGIGWGTVGLALSSPDALALQGLPSTPATEKEPVLVYGGATATGTMACRLLRLSGYSPIAVTSTTSGPLALEYSAIGTVPYSSPKCVQMIRELAGETPIRHVLDCITSPESVETCFASMARTGGRYACLERMNESWRTRRAIRVKEVMGYEALGVEIDLGPESSTYSRQANQELFAIGARWATEMQSLLNADAVRPHPIQEVTGVWDGIIDGLGMLQRSEVRGHKLVVRIATL